MKLSLCKILFVCALMLSILKYKTASAQYCTDSLYINGCSTGYYLNDVTLGSISNFNTGCSGNDGYSDYTSISTDLEQGSMYALSIRIGDFPQGVNMWIDFNDDSTFDESERLVDNFNCESLLLTYSASFVIPSSAPLGNHRMRIRAADEFFGIIDPCTQYYSGEVEDYSVDIVPPTDMTYISSTTTQTETGSVGVGDTNVVIIGIQIVTSGTLNPLTISSFTLNSSGCTAFSDDVTNVKIYYYGNDNYFNYTDTLFGSATDLSSPIYGSLQLAQDTNYFLVMYNINPNGIFGDYLDAECTSITINGIDYMPAITAPAGNRQIQYCNPVDLYGCYFAYIDGIQLNTLSNTFSYCNGNADGYINYPATGNHTTSLQEGNSYPIYLIGSPYEEEGFGVWMDLNNDGDFDDSGEFLFATPDTGVGWQSGYITVPVTTSPGEHRMRVRCNDYNILTGDQSCAQLNYGETEDYTITVAPSSCSAYFTLTPDSLIPHHYWAINQASGTLPLYYLWSWGDGTYDSSAYPSHTYDTAGFYTICLTIIDSTGCTSTFCNIYDIQKSSEAESIITVDVVDSIPDIATSMQNTSILNSYSVFPNPASENLLIRYSLSVSASVGIELDDVLGNKLVQSEEKRPQGESSSDISVAGLAGGIYLLKIHAGNQGVSTKIVVTK